MARQVQLDVDTHTCPVRPSIDPESGLGYVEVFEGPLRDRDFLVTPDGVNLVEKVSGNEQFQIPDPNMHRRDLFYTGSASSDYDSSFGDLDDMLALTVRSTDKPFVGRVSPTGPIVESWEAATTWT